MKQKQDKFIRSWIIENALDEIPNYEPGELTLRGLHYRLVARGMPNTIQHYKRVCAALAWARWEGIVDIKVFIDHERDVKGETEYVLEPLEAKIDETKEAVEYWIENYYLSRWANQPNYVEVWIEKKALYGILGKVCKSNGVALAACKGYPSITFLDDASRRFVDAENSGMNPTILYFGDYDPTGEDIPRNINDSIQRLGCHSIEVDRIALMERQVLDRGLPPAPTKVKDSRAATWTGIGQVELDAIEPRELKSMCEEAILSYFDQDIYSDLMDQEAEEKIEYVATLKEFVKTL